MLPEREEALRTTLIANLMLALKGGDARRTACGLAAMVQVLVDNDLLGRMALAQILREAASELDQPPKRFARPQVETCSSIIQFAARRQ
jgi:hypothetical protein